jgi:hypothetical protein
MAHSKNPSTLADHSRQIGAANQNQSQSLDMAIRAISRSVRQRSPPRRQVNELQKSERFAYADFCGADARYQDRRTVLACGLGIRTQVGWLSSDLSCAMVSLRFTSRNQRDLTKRFPELQSIAKSIKASTAIIDGEVVALDENGVQCFEQLQNHKRDCAIIYFAFDLMFLNGESLTDLPLIERKKHLKRILPKSLTGRVRFTDHVIENGLDLFTALEAQQLEGMVAKRADSLYVSGRSKDWLKVKTRAGRKAMTKRIETWAHR